MQRIKHLFFIFSLLLVFASSVWSVDLNCPGGRWATSEIIDYEQPCRRWHVLGQRWQGLFGGGNLTCSDISDISKTTYSYYTYAFPQENPGDMPVCTEGPVSCDATAFIIYHKEIAIWQCPAVCTDGQTKSCAYTGPAGTEGIGMCKAGTQTCTNGQWGACQGEVTPQTEVCGDNKDNNCNGQTDEGCCNVSVNISPTVVWPKNAGNDSNTTSTVTVSLTNPAPPTGCTVNLSIEPVNNSGGHSHDGNRPKGTVNSSVLPIPSGSSQITTAYISSEVSGEERIIATATGGNTSETIITVRVPRLGFLGNSIMYRFTGSTTSHSSNHFGTPTTNRAVFNIAFDYWYQNDAILGINDMSLPYGGLFDICGTWNPRDTCTNVPRGGHSSHRKGTSVDIDRCAESTTTNNPNPRGTCPTGWIGVDRNEIGKICNNHNGRLIPEGTIHCEISQ